MNPADLSIVLGFIATVCVSVGLPLWLRRKDKQAAAAAQAEKDRVALTATTEVTWEAINRALVRERDSAVSALRSAKEEFDKALAELKSTHNGEIAAMAEKLVTCKAEVDRLYRELAEARRSPPTR